MNPMILTKSSQILITIAGISDYVAWSDNKESRENSHEIKVKSKQSLNETVKE